MNRDAQVSANVIKCDSGYFCAFIRVYNIQGDPYEVLQDFDIDFLKLNVWVYVKDSITVQGHKYMILNTK